MSKYHQICVHKTNWETLFPKLIFYDPYIIQGYTNEKVGIQFFQCFSTMYMCSSFTEGGAHWLQMQELSFLKSEATKSFQKD